MSWLRFLRRRRQESIEDGPQSCDPTEIPAPAIPLHLRVQEIHTPSISEEEHVDVASWARERLVAAGFMVSPQGEHPSAPLVIVNYEEKPVDVDVSVTQLGIGESELRRGVDIHYEIEIVSASRQEILFRASSKVPAIDGMVRSWSTGAPGIILYHDAVDRCLYSSLLSRLPDLALIGVGQKTYVEFLEEVLSQDDEDPSSQFLREAFSVLDQYPFELTKSAIGMCVRYARPGIVPTPVEEFFVRTAAKDFDVIEEAIEGADQEFRDAIYRVLDSAEDLIVETPQDESEAIRTAGRLVRKVKSKSVSHREERLKVYDAIAKVGEHGAEAFIQLLSDMPYDYRRMELVEALVAMGPVAVRPLVDALDDKHDVVRAGVCKALSRIGKPAIEPLNDVLHTKGDRAQKLAAEILDKIKNEP